MTARRRPVRVVATDLDGTLLRADQTVGPRTLDALADAEAAGVTIVFVTGRPPRWLEPAADATGHRGIAVCANGALVVDLASGEVLRARTIDREVGLEALQRLRAADPGLAFGVEYADGFAHEPAYPRGTRREQDGVNASTTVGELEELFARPVVKLLARSETRSSEELARALAPLVDGLAEVTYSSVRLLEMGSAGVTKASTLAGLVSDSGASATDVLAFGDMPNDVPMLLWAGWAVAVANAHPLVLEVADDVTASNEDDGVGRYLEGLLDSSPT